METLMIKLAFFARFEAKPGKEQAVAKFLETALAMAKKEPTTINWYALRLSPSTFGVFDTFNDENGRQTHLNGPIGQALNGEGPRLWERRARPMRDMIIFLGSFTLSLLAYALLAKFVWWESMKTEPSSKAD